MTMSEKSAGEFGGEAHEVPVPLTGTKLAEQVAELEETVQALNNVLSTVSARMLRHVDDLKDDLLRKVGYADLEGVQKDFEKLRDRIDDIVDEVGYGEALDIAKVPPSILELAYQAVLDDVVAELQKARGVHDAEQHILHSLEQVRLKTSGSELFHYKPHRLHADVARALEKGLASARQVNTTFAEVLRHLLEPIHYHTPKNFRALVKIKSQEYAVDKALSLANAADRTTEDVQSLRTRVNRLEEQVMGALRDVQDFAGTLHGTMAGLATRESVEALTMRLADLERRLERASGASPLPASRDAGAALEARVLSSFGPEPRSLASMRKDLDVDEGALREVLEDLERRGLISSSVRGRYTMYRKEERNDA